MMTAINANPGYLDIPKKISRTEFWKQRLFRVNLATLLWSLLLFIFAVSAHDNEVRRWGWTSWQHMISIWRWESNLKNKYWKSFMGWTVGHPIKGLYKSLSRVSTTHCTSLTRYKLWRHKTFGKYSITWFNQSKQISLGFFMLLIFFRKTNLWI